MKKRSLKYLRRAKRSKQYQTRKRAAPLGIVGESQNSGTDSYVDENLSGLCRALLLDSGISASHGLRSSQKGEVFSDTFSFNKERDENQF